MTLTSVARFCAYDYQSIAAATPPVIAGGASMIYMTCTDSAERKCMAKKPIVYTRISYAARVSHSHCK